MVSLSAAGRTYAFEIRGGPAPRWGCTNSIGLRALLASRARHPGVVAGRALNQVHREPNSTCQHGGRPPFLDSNGAGGASDLGPSAEHRSVALHRGVRSPGGRNHNDLHSADRANVLLRDDTLGGVVATLRAVSRNADSPCIDLEIPIGKMETSPPSGVTAPRRTFRVLVVRTGSGGERDASPWLQRTCRADVGILLRRCVVPIC